MGSNVIESSLPHEYHKELAATTFATTSASDTFRTYLLETRPKGTDKVIPPHMSFCTFWQMNKTFGANTSLLMFPERRELISS